ncbi:AAA family ATPase [Hymenobacter sublimis]|uniref:ATP-binding protein n=1 Tax=Hymenobacter sublimis TaxID=2933777 RepID=A0ABY4J5Q1_9BACT|nr:AAA family ATPase [Hymenobacter sublimis]UPL48159.1 ATP-binding protein [Hymenobacter sublimis]
METLEVRNFGPIVRASIVLKDVNIFIGPSSSGKSTIAKLCAILNDYDFIKKVKRFSKFKEYLEKYNVSEYLTTNTYIRYDSDVLTLTINNGRISNVPKENIIIDSYNALFQYAKLSQTVDFEYTELEVYEPVFEHLRILSEPIVKSLNQLSYKAFYNFKSITHRASFIYSKIFTELDSDNYDLDDESLYYDEDEFEEIVSEIELLTKNSIIFFRNELSELKSVQSSTYIPAERILFSLITEKVFSFENAKLALPQVMIDFGTIVEKAKISSKEYNLDFIGTKYKFDKGKNIITQNGYETELSKAASGIQTIIPLYLAIEYKIYTNDQNTNFIIEEPELNLYPTNQKKLIEYIIAKCTNKNGSLTITTHSPYILTCINNFIQGANAFQERPEMIESIKDIISPNYWLEYNRVSAYYINNGLTENIMNSDIKSIGASKIDDVSEEIGNEFNQLTDIIYS